MAYHERVPFRLAKSMSTPHTRTIAHTHIHINRLFMAFNDLNQTIYLAS